MVCVRALEKGVVELETAGGRWHSALEPLRDTLQGVTAASSGTHTLVRRAGV